MSVSAVWLSGQLALHSLQALGSLAREHVSSLRPILTRKFSNITAPAFSVAVHIRRGDSCERWTATVGDHDQVNKGGRPCYDTKLYVEAVLKMYQHYALTSIEVRLATDSFHAARNFVSRMKHVIPEARVYLLHYNRHATSGESPNEIPRSGAVPPLFIEHRNAGGEIDREQALVYFVSEMLLLSEADAFVGTPGSMVSKFFIFRAGWPPCPHPSIRISRRSTSVRRIRSFGR